MGPSLGAIRENCVGSVFMFLAPPEICNLAFISWCSFVGFCVGEEASAELPGQFLDVASSIGFATDLSDSCVIPYRNSEISLPSPSAEAIQICEGKPDEAIQICEELVKEDPKDYRRRFAGVTEITVPDERDFELIKQLGERISETISVSSYGDQQRRVIKDSGLRSDFGTHREECPRDRIFLVEPCRRLLMTREKETTTSQAYDKDFLSYSEYRSWIFERV